ncbi:MAG: hypothetical protein JSV56_11085 [Methanomassiliicoccales archaeon]|nr:MAG: hypothetical protein JSV56_11085 [Methanomassiliicoccales archaeon]
MRLRVPKKLAEEIEDLSKQRGESLESMLRTILIDFINKEGERSGQLYEETVAYGDMELEGPKEEFKAQSVVVEMESEADEYPIARKEEDIGIRIEENVVEEEGVEGELLDLEATANGSEVDEFGSDEDFEDEDIFDIEAEDEEENELVVEDDEDLDEDLSEIEVVEEEPSQPEVEEIISHEEPEDIFEEKDLSDIEPFEEKKEETELKEFKPIPKKKKATKKKIVLRKKKLRHKKE